MFPLMQTPSWVSPSKEDSSTESRLLEILHNQQHNAERQQQLMENLPAVIQAQQNPNKEMVKPDPFYGESSSPETTSKHVRITHGKNLLSASGTCVYF